MVEDCSAMGTLPCYSVVSSNLCFRIINGMDQWWTKTWSLSHKRQVDHEESEDTFDVYVM